jgi:hypothetical protein
MGNPFQKEIERGTAGYTGLSKDDVRRDIVSDAPLFGHKAKSSDRLSTGA